MCSIFKEISQGNAYDIPYCHHTYFLHSQLLGLTASDGGHTLQELGILQWEQEFNNCSCLGTSSLFIFFSYYTLDLLLVLKKYYLSPKLKFVFSIKNYV